MKKAAPSGGVRVPWWSRRPESRQLWARRRFGGSYMIILLTVIQWSIGEGWSRYMSDSGRSKGCSWQSPHPSHPQTRRILGCPSLQPLQVVSRASVSLPTGKRDPYRKRLPTVATRNESRTNQPGWREDVAMARTSQRVATRPKGLGLRADSDPYTGTENNSH